MFHFNLKFVVFLNFFQFQWFRFYCFSTFEWGNSLIFSTILYFLYSLNFQTISFFSFCSAWVINSATVQLLSEKIHVFLSYFYFSTFSIPKKRGIFPFFSAIETCFVKPLFLILSDFRYCLQRICVWNGAILPTSIFHRKIRSC